jgi:hypothetical protein
MSSHLHMLGVACASAHEGGVLQQCQGEMPHSRPLLGVAWISEFNCDWGMVPHWEEKVVAAVVDPSLLDEGGWHE